MEREIRTGRYFSANFQAMIIVAVINTDRDWAAYASGVDYTMEEEEAADWCARNGCKMAEKDAKYFFPDIKLPYRH